MNWSKEVSQTLFSKLQTTAQLQRHKPCFQSFRPQHGFGDTNLVFRASDACASRLRRHKPCIQSFRKQYPFTRSQKWITEYYAGRKVPKCLFWSCVSDEVETLKTCGRNTVQCLAEFLQKHNTFFQRFKTLFRVLKSLFRVTKSFFQRFKTFIWVSKPWLSLAEIFSDFENN